MRKCWLSGIIIQVHCCFSLVNSPLSPCLDVAHRIIQTFDAGGNSSLKSQSHLYKCETLQGMIAYKINQNKLIIR